MNDDSISILKANTASLTNSVTWLTRSYDICAKIPDLIKPNPEEMDALEALTSRFARTADLLFNKIYRSIHYIQEGESRPWLDVLLFMEKTGLINSIEDARIIKELRNDIVHEYAMQDINPLYIEVMRQCPRLMKMTEVALEEAARILKKLDNF